MDNMKTWTGLPVEESIRMTDDRDKWRNYVHGVANPRIEDGYRTEQNKTEENVLILQAPNSPKHLEGALPLQPIRVTANLTPALLPSSSRSARVCALLLWNGRRLRRVADERIARSRSFECR